ncbi:MAG: Rossmann-like and DUF2520 domain-containing protein [Ferruginibacter sp.]
MNVAIIGSGNVAATLGRLIAKSEHKVIHIASRDIGHAATLAKEFNAAFSDYKAIGEVNADIFIIAVSDAAIMECTGNFNLNDKLVVHTAGSVSMDILKDTSENYGILYPLQSLRKEKINLPDIPFLIDGNSEEVIQFLEAFVHSLHCISQRTNDNERLKLHAAAVIVSNFTNHLFALAEEFCNKENVPFDLLKPLINETAQRINDLSPGNLQTGPALRKDIITLDKHLKLLGEYPGLRSIYLKLTDSIMNYPSEKEQ